MVQIDNSYETSEASQLMAAVRNRGDSTAFALIFAGILALGILAFIAIANLVFTGTAAAQAPSGDVQDICRAYQTDYDNALAGLSDPSAPVATRATLQDHLDLIGDYWNLECADDFGAIAVGAQVMDAATNGGMTTTFSAFDFGQGSNANPNQLASTSAAGSVTN